MTIRARLALGLFAIAVILIVPLGLSLQSLRRLHLTTIGLRDREFAASLLLGRMRAGADDLRDAETALIFIHETESRDAMSTRIAALSAMADSLGRAGVAGPARHIRSAINDVARYAPLEYQAALAGRAVAADTLSSRHIVPAIRRVERAIGLAELSLAERTSERVAEAAQATVDAQRAAGFALVTAAAFALAIAYVLWRSISRPVQDLEEGMAAVADGRFDYRLEVSPSRRDEFGRLAESFQSMAAQLAQLDRLKAEFISVASHELKTPLNVILGYVQLLDEGMYGPVSMRQRDILRTLDAQTRSIARLVHQLLDVSRFEAGGGKLYPRAISLERFLADLGTTFRVLSLQRAIDFRIERVGALPAEVYWDSDRINEVLGNLLSNAFKFTSRQGTIELRVEAAGSDLHIVVRDTGAGIPPAQLPRIFEKFYQADNQRRASIGGTGLGLAIAKQIVVAHGGTIAADSVLGLGTTFSITLPARVDWAVAAPTRELPVGELV